MNELMAAYADALAGNPAPTFTYSISRAGRGRRVVWTGGTRNGVAVPSGDVTLDAGETYDRLVKALRDGGFHMGGQYA
jgi:hypothetical protein